MILTPTLQALLVKHETYMAEAEAERRRMSANLSNLESDKRELEATNASVIRENRRLLDELEKLNGTISSAENEIQSLTVTIQSSMQEVDRLNILATQASRLEQQLSKLESEHVDLQKQLTLKGEGERSANRRWRRAEFTITALQEQLEKIEKEAGEERARHAEVVARFERRRNVEKELENAAKRSRAAAAKIDGQEDNSKSVVSNFVTEVLQDNANLQMGIVELRELLMCSNEEVQNLRDQIMLHQPLDEATETAISNQSLEHELARLPARDSAPDLHVHHHYHAAPAPPSTGTSEKPAGQRRAKKRRNVILPGSRPATMSTPGARMLNYRGIELSQPSAANAILAQTSVTIPPIPRSGHNPRWSMSQAPSSATASSLPSSPMFDRADDFLDDSRPTTPGSSNFGSPAFPPQQPKKETGLSVPGRSDTVPYRVSEPRSISSVLGRAEPSPLPNEDGDPQFPLLDNEIIPEEHEIIPEEYEVISEESEVVPEKPEVVPEEPEAIPKAPEVIPEEHEEDDDSSAHTISLNPKSQTEVFNPSIQNRPTRHHRASSHESILSTRGLVVPAKLGPRPAHRMLSGSRPSLATASPVSSGPIAGGTWAVAHRSKTIRRYDSTSNYNKLLSASNTSVNPTAKAAPAAPATTFSRRVGGWIAGKWGIAPESSAAAGTASVSPNPSSDSKKQKPSSGGGGTKAERLPTYVEPTSVDETLLRDTIGEVEGLGQGAKTAASTGTAPAVPPPPPVPRRTSSQQQQKQQKQQEKNKKNDTNNRNSTHVEAVDVDSHLLADALGEV